MRKLFIAVLIALMVVPALAADIKTEDEKTLYAIGALVSRDLDVFKLTPEELQLVQQGFADNILGKKLIAEPAAYQDKMNQLAQKRMGAAAEIEKQKSVNFLEKAAKEKGAKKMASGMVYIPIKVGTGKQPKPADTVKVHYTGKLVDGTTFDSSVKRGEPTEFQLSKVISCWTEGVGMMKAGGKSKLVCPSYTAYGDAGHPPVIPGGATLIFEVELLEVKK
jgi:FKBP-type peptidyl-prolyl cis-trans isomerase FkpA